VPSVYIDNGPPLTQSIAILEYLEETHPEPPLLPSDARGRARVRALALLWAADHHPLIVPRIRRYLTEELKVNDETRMAWLRHWFRQGLVLGEAALNHDPMTGRFCYGDTPTHADLCLMSQAMAAHHSGVDFSDLPTIDGIVKACLEMDAFARALPLRQKGAPTAH
jgi:maleylacetoacetate isomerase